MGFAEVQSVPVSTLAIEFLGEEKKTPNTKYSKQENLLPM